MSHFTKLAKAQITDVDAFIAACADLGLTEVMRDAKIKDFYGKEITVDVAIKTGKYSIALQKNEQGKFDMISDWWGVRGDLASSPVLNQQGIRNDADLQDAILRHTTKNTIIQRYKRLGFRASVEEDDDHNLTVNLVRA